jgi:hypothetical protein
LFNLIDSEFSSKRCSKYGFVEKSKLKLFKVQFLEKVLFVHGQIENRALVVCEVNANGIK